MTLLELLQILGAVFALGKDGMEIIDELHKLGFKPSDTIPAAYLRRLRDSRAAIPDEDDQAWEDLHVSEGG